MMNTIANKESFLVLEDDLETRTIMLEMVSALGFHCTARKKQTGSIKPSGTPELRYGHRRY